MRSKHSFLDFMGESSDKQAEVKIACFWFHIQRHRITNRRCWQPPLIPDSPTLPPTGFPPKQHPAAEPEEDDEEEESPHPRQLDHHPGAAGSRLEVARREENLQPSALCDHSVMWRQRRGGGEETCVDLMKWSAGGDWTWTWRQQVGSQWRWMFQLDIFEFPAGTFVTRSHIYRQWWFTWERFWVHSKVWWFYLHPSCQRGQSSCPVQLRW